MLTGHWQFLKQIQFMLHRKRGTGFGPVGGCPPKMMDRIHSKDLHKMCLFFFFFFYLCILVCI